MLDTIITRREQFHDFEIGEYINEYRPVVHERVQSLANTFMSKGYDAVTAKQQAFTQISDTVRQNAYILAFDDAFLIIAITLLICAVLIWFCRKTTANEGAQRRNRETVTDYSPGSGAQ
jgi:DHA2 family multidrug resistance protein